MQSTTCPAMSGVNRCPLLDILRFKRSWRTAKVFAIGFEVLSTLPMSVFDTTGGQIVIAVVTSTDSRKD